VGVTPPWLQRTSGSALPLVVVLQAVLSGDDHRVRLGDLLAYQQRARRARAAGLDEMVRDAEDAGLYDLPEDAVVDRMSVADDGSDRR
jgi:hypothetical protein